MEELRDFSILAKLIDLDPKKAAQLNNDSKIAKARHEQFKTDIAGFAKYYFSHYISLEPADWHKELFKVFESVQFDPKNGKPYFRVSQKVALNLASMHRKEFSDLPMPIERLRGIGLCGPREQAKSTVFARIVLIWGLIFGYFRYTVLIRSSSDIADSFLRDTMIEFEDNTKLIADYGNLKGSTWKEGSYLLKNGAAVVAIGRGQAVRGLVYREKRPDLIIVDDIITDQDAESISTLNKVYKWLTSAIFGLSKNALIMMLNTIYNDVDPLSKILKRIKDRELTDWLGVRFSAEIIDGQQALWPEYWPIESLRAKKKEVGSLDYMIQYQSIIENKATALIKADHIIYKEKNTYNLYEYDLALGVDPNAEGKDDVAVTFGAKHKLTRKLLILDIWSKDWGSITDLSDKLVGWYEKAKVVGNGLIYVAFEENGFQKVYQKLLQPIFMSQGINIPFVGVQAKGSKTERARSIGVWVENGTLEFDSKLEGSTEIYRLTNFPQKGLPDGVVDSTAHCLEAFNRGSARPVGKAAKRSRGNELPNLLRRYRNG